MTAKVSTIDLYSKEVNKVIKYIENAELRNGLIKTKAFYSIIRPKISVNGFATKVSNLLTNNNITPTNKLNTNIRLLAEAGLINELLWNKRILKV